jgi:hypothetical protein
MTQTLTHVYNDYASAEMAVRELKAAGLGDSHIGLVASNAEGWHKPGSDSVDPKHDKDRDGKDDRSEGAVTGGGLGAIAGGAVGVAAGLGTLAIPGIGPVVAAGWLVGGATGGVIGALVESGSSKENAALYAEALRRGGAIVTAKVSDDDAGKYKAILSRNDVDVSARERAYRETGWRGYDPAAPAYTADEISRERQLYRR